MEFCRVRSVKEQRCLQPDGLTILKNLVAMSKFKAPEAWCEDPQILVATVQNVVTQETWRPRLCTFASTSNINSVHILYSTHSREFGVLTS